MISSFPDTYINMKKLLSLPPNLVNSFHKIAKVNVDEWFCTSDPVGARLGSGGGTTWLIEACRQNEAPQISVKEWLAKEKRILLHAGGQSRRLPGYAPSGKILTPIPVFRWARGQKLSQNLLSLQLPLYEEIMYKAPDSLHTLIASGDVYIRNSEPLQDIPEVDVVCYGLWVDPALATNHGVFVSDRQTPDKLDFMLQKPSLDDLGKLAQTHLFLMDIGVWLLSDRAMELLMKHSYTADGKTMKSYDLYSEFGLALGEHPRIADTELNQLSVAILPLEGGEFYHYGTSRELISSTLAVQNLVRDQRAIMHRKVKPHPAMFVQNAAIDLTLTAENSELWIENSYIGKNWKLDNRHIITGVPANNWELDLPSGVCIDVVPVGEQDWAARPYGFNDPFKGASDNEKTLFMGCPVIQWGKDRGVTFEPFDDLQNAPLFPVCKNVDELGLVIRWMVSEPGLENGRKIWETSRKMSANELSDYANLDRLFAQREKFRYANWPMLAANHEKSVFYQLDLADAAREFAGGNLALPEVLGPCLFAVFMALSRTAFGVWGARWNLRRILILSALLGIACYLITALSPIPVLSLLGCALCGLAVSLMWPGLFSLTAAVYPKGGTAMFGVLAVMGDVGCSVGPWLSGLVSDRAQQSQAILQLGASFGFDPQQTGLRAGMLAAVIFPLIMATSLLFFRRRSEKELDA